MKNYFLILIFIFIGTYNLNAQVYVSATGSDTSPYNSWATAANDLQDGIDEAESQPGIVQVWVKADTYIPGTNQTDYFILEDNVEIYGGFNGTETLLSQRDYNTNITYLSAEINGAGLTDNCEHIFYNDGDGDNSKIDGFYFTRGYADGGGGGGRDDRGGAIHNRNVNTITIENCIFYDNHSEQEGGAIYNDNSSLTLINCFFANNINQNANESGGAIYTNNNASVSILNCVFANNESTEDGGAIYFDDDPTITMKNCTFSNNLADDRGGAINNEGILNMESTILWSNDGLGGNNEIRNSGGGVLNDIFCDIEGDGGTINTDPLFIAPSGGDGVGFSGLTADWSIPVNSPCVETGNPGAAGLPSIDMASNDRIRGNQVDIGAYEVQNLYPTDIALAPNNVDEALPIGTVVGTLSTTDPNSADAPPDTHTYTLVAGAGDTHNANFTIDGDEIKTAKIFNFDTDVNPQLIRVRTTDSGTGNLTYEEAMTVTINDVNIPPQFDSNPVIVVLIGNFYSYNPISVSDTDDPFPPALVISCPTIPVWLGFIDNLNNTASLTGFAPGVAGEHSVVLEVTDGVNTVQQSYTIKVVNNYIDVPADEPTIQDGINIANTDQAVRVFPGTYNENVNFNGKNILVFSQSGVPANTIINGTQSGSVVTFENGETNSAILDGFTITNGNGNAGIAAVFSDHAPASGYYGGGIFCYQSGPVLQNLIVSNNSLAVNNNHGGSGSGIYIGNVSTPVLRDITIEDNISNIYRGGGLCIDDSNVTLENSTIQNNSAGNYGGGIAIYNSTVNLTNITISNNTVGGSNGRGGGAYYHNSVVNETNVTKAGNSASTAGNDEYQF